MGMFRFNVGAFVSGIGIFRFKVGALVAGIGIFRLNIGVVPGIGIFGFIRGATYSFGMGMFMAKTGGGRVATAGKGIFKLMIGAAYWIGNGISGTILGLELPSLYELCCDTNFGAPFSCLTAAFSLDLLSSFVLSVLFFSSVNFPSTVRIKSSDRVNSSPPSATILNGLPSSARNSCNSVIS